MKRIPADELMSYFRGLQGDADLASKVQAVVDDVRVRGLAAALEYTERFDKVKLSSVRVPEAALDAALAALPVAQRKALNHAAANIRRFAQAQRDSVQGFRVEHDGIELGQIIVPIERVGVYVPGGRYPLLSSALMTIIPAQVAGVGSVAVCSPPGPAGLPASGILAACALLGAREVYALGGAQAIAAMAYGVDGLPPVDKIVGPGNQYVSQAKELVSRRVAIDFFAGPSEVLILADDTADAAAVASDLLSQAEHDVQARAFLVTPSAELAERVAAAVAEQLKWYDAASPIHEAARSIGVVVCQDLGEAVALSNAVAPEHLELQVENAEAVSTMLRHYGSLFIGPWSPVALGDYASGTNHTLPTQGGARAAGGLSVFHFLKIQTWQRASQSGLAAIADTVKTLADLEQLPAHKKSIDIRLTGQGPGA